jgi:hypothetical protein
MQDTLTHIAVLILGLQQRKRDYKAGSPRWMQLEQAISDRFKGLDSAGKGDLIDRMSELKKQFEMGHDWVSELQNH